MAENNIELSMIASPLVNLRNHLYEKGILKSIHLSLPVISVGNLTMGGTGKTPFINWLIQLLKNQTLNPAVVTKSYKAGNKSPQKVSFGYNDHRHFGDEAVLLALKNPTVEVWSGPHKGKTASAVDASKKAGLILVDDGFQHRGLHRNLDIVLLDSSVEVSDYAFPFKGRARESFSSLGRAQVVVITKIEQARSETIELIEYEIKKYPHLIVLKSRQIFGKPQFFAGRKSEFNFNNPTMGFAGIGNPESFKKSLLEMKVRLQEFRALEDHAVYEINLIKELATLTLVNQVITTEKDSVKLQDWPKDGPPLFTLPMNLMIEGELGKFHDVVRKVATKA